MKILFLYRENNSQQLQCVDPLKMLEQYKHLLTKLNLEILSILMRTSVIDKQLVSMDNIEFVLVSAFTSSHINIIIKSLQTKDD